MAERLGKSRTSITEILALSAMPDEVRHVCRLADIHSKSLLLQVVRQGDMQKMIALVQRLQKDGGGRATREDARKIAKQGKAKAKGRPRHYVFRYQPRERSFALSLQFRKSDVPRDEIVKALQSIIEDLLREEA
jgi:ParB family chromosome partitioning protein